QAVPPPPPRSKAPLNQLNSIIRSRPRRNQSLCTLRDLHRRTSRQWRQNRLLPPPTSFFFALPRSSPWSQLAPRAAACDPRREPAGRPAWLAVLCCLL